MDIILDIVLDREKFLKIVQLYLDFIKRERQYYIHPPAIIINTQYIGQKLIQKEKCRSAINYLIEYFIILKANISIIKKAHESKFGDIEDGFNIIRQVKIMLQTF